MMPNPTEYFMARSIPEPNSGCWLWTGSTHYKGYGEATFAGKKHKAHRLSWLSFKGAIPDGQLVCHQCDVPQCCNPGHLFLGTNDENMADRSRKGRQARKFGDAEKDKIIAAYLAGQTMKRVGQEFGATASGVFRILKKSGVASRKSFRPTTAARSKMSAAHKIVAAKRPRNASGRFA